MKEKTKCLRAAKAIMETIPVMPHSVGDEERNDFIDGLASGLAGDEEYNPPAVGSGCDCRRRDAWKNGRKAGLRLSGKPGKRKTVLTNLREIKMASKMADLARRKILSRKMVVESDLLFICNVEIGAELEHGGKTARVFGFSNGPLGEGTVACLKAFLIGIETAMREGKD